jgi:hypothetical protein
MRTVNNMIQAQNQIDLPFELEEALVDTQSNYVELQKEQMLHGLNAEGASIGTYVNAQYASMKNSLNPIPGFGKVDLKLTGQFYQDIYADARSEGIIVDSADQKSESLQQRYGQIIFGLADDRKQEYINELGPVLIQNLIEKLNATAL